MTSGAFAAAVDSEQRRVVGEDPLVQPPQLRPRLDTELLGEHPAQLVEGCERRLLAQEHVERAQPPLPQRLAIGVLDDQRDQVRDDPVRVPVASRTSRRCCWSVTRTSASRCGPAPAIRCRGRRRRVCPASDPVRRSAIRRASTASVVVPAAAAVAVEDLGVDRVRCDGQPVALLVAPHQYSIAACTAGLQHPAQSPDERVQRTAGASGWI